MAMAVVQKKGLFTVAGKNQRKNGFLNPRETQLPNLKPELESRETDLPSDAYNITETYQVGRKVVYQNTYKTSPDKRFPVKEVEKIIHGVLEENFSGEKYDSEKCRDKSKKVSQIIKEKVKQMKISRYKLVTVVHVGENQGQDVKIASQCLWSCEFDSSATASLMNPYLFAQGTVFGIYFE